MNFKNDKALRYIIDNARGKPFINKLVLFGSRARGDHSEKSDYDIAVYADGSDEISRWILNIKEEIPTLCGVDLVDVNRSTSKGLMETISREGIVIYEQ